MSKIFTANRVAAILTWLTGLSAFIVGITQTLPHSWQNTALVIGGLLTKLVTAVHFMTGSQKFDALIANSADKQAVTQPPPYFMTNPFSGANVQPGDLPSGMVPLADEVSSKPETAVTPDAETTPPRRTTRKTTRKPSTAAKRKRALV